MFNLFKSIGNELQTLVFPGKCLKCGTILNKERGTPLSSCYCPECMGKVLPFFYPPFCTCCGQVFEARIGESHLCEGCLKGMPPLGQVRAAFEYKGVVREGLGLFKYQSRLCLARPFETHMFDAFDVYFSDKKIDLILPIPLHFQKARKRGFNQSFFLVRNFVSLYRKNKGKLPSWTIDIHGLVRIKATPSQTGLDPGERKKNLKQAFEWKQKNALKGKSVLLIDDVYTTGSTCNAAAKTLLKAGADRVDALVLARA